MSVIHDATEQISYFSTRMRKALRVGLSHDAIDAAQPVAYKYQDKTITHSVGKKHKFARRIIDYKRKGPLQRQVGLRWLHGESWPIMQTYFVHRLLHATKGWREYTGGPALRMPLNGMRPNLPYPMRFFGPNHRWA